MKRNHLSGGTRRFALWLLNLRSRPGAWVRLLFLTLLLLLSSAPGQAQWTAYFDFSRGPATAPTNVLSFEYNWGSGYLTNQFTGQPLPAFLDISDTENPPTITTDPLPSSTPAHTLFDGFCDLRGTPGYLLYFLPMTSSFILTNLNPAARYNIAGSIHLNNASYTERITHVELQSADTCVPAHTPGVITNGLPVSQAALVCYNPTGEYVAWSNIDPGADGAIVLTCSRFTNQSAYALGALKIEELPIPIAVNSQPQDAVICPGDSLALALDVSGSQPITYNWFVITNNTTNLVATGSNSTLTLTNLQQSFSWFATASNVVNQATSRVAQVTVTTDIVITTQPASQDVALGQSVSFSVGVMAGCPHYQWFKNGVVVPNATNATYVILSVAASHVGRYAVQLTNIYGTSFMSDEAALTINTNSVLFVARTNLNAADLAISNMLNSLGFAVVVQDDRTAASSHATGKSLITISYTADPVEVGGAFGFSAVPLICWQPRLFNTHFLTASLLNQGTTPDQQSIAIYDPSLPLAAGLTGTNLVFSSSQSLSYGVPGRNAVVAAVATNGTELPVIFGYEKGAVAAVGGFLLPARRVGFFLGETNATSLTTTGSNLFAAAVRWATSPPVPANTPVGISKQPDSVSVPAGLNATFSVNVTGAPPYYLQWRRNGTNIPGATGRTLSWGPVSDADQNAAFTLYVTNRVSSATSTVATLTVLGPIPIAITTQPKNRTLAPGQTASFTVGLTGGSPRFQWYKNGIPVSDATNQSYSIPNVGLGDTAAYHVVITNTVNSVTSAPAFLFVQPPGYQLIDLPHLWKYNQDAIDLGTHWFDTDFDDSAWPSGPGALAYEDNPAISPLIGTPLSLTNNGQSIQTHYFRTTFNLTNDPNAVLLTLNGYFDDGAVVYLNGQEAFRTNMLTGPVSYSTPARRYVDEPSSVLTWIITNAAPGLLVKGTNHLAVEVHQDSLISSDIVMALRATVTHPSPTPLAITRQPQSATIDELRPLAISVDWTGTPAAFQWFKETSEGPIAVPGANSTALTFPNPTAGVDDGTYFVEITNLFYRTVSLSATITITQAPPSVMALPPVAAACPGGPFTLHATAFGTQPLHYQWRFNDQDIPNATNASFSVESAAIAHAGGYSVYVSNALGTALSSPSLLQVTTAPVIVAPPTPQAAFPSNSVTFKVQAGSCGPFSYQWQFNQTDLPGAGGSALHIYDVQLTNQGLYRVIVSNPHGVVYSEEVPLVSEFGVALNYTNTAWMNGQPATYTFGTTYSVSNRSFSVSVVGGHPQTLWLLDSTVTHDGAAAIRSTVVDANLVSKFSTSITGPGKVSFWWKMDAPDPAAGLLFFCGYANPFLLAGATNWQQSSFYIPYGSVSLEWFFAHNYSSNQPVAWIDQFEFTTNTLSPRILLEPRSLNLSAGSDAKFSVSADGHPWFTYQWRFNGVDLPGATLPMLTVPRANETHAGSYTVVVVNDFGAVTSQVATLSIENAAPVFAPTRGYVLTTPGGDASLDSAVLGSGPMTFQWYFDGVALPGATNETLFLRGITAEQAGRYRLAATNSLGGAIGPETELILTSISQVIHIAGEGLGGTYLCGALWAEPERYPNFSKLVREGSSTMNARCDFTETITVPNYVSIFTGRPVRQPDGQADTVHHGFVDNFPSSGWILHDRGNTNVPYKTSVFDVAHDNGLKTAFLFSKSTISMCAESYNAANGAPDLLPPDNGSNKIDFIYLRVYSSNLVDNFLPTLSSNAPFNYTFLHFREMDYIGHGRGWGSPEWFSTLADLDAFIGEILSAIETNTNPAIRYGTAVIITADHGGDGSTHTNSLSPANYTIPLMVWGPGFPGGTDLYTRFANRADPGTNRLDYNAVWQPLRNGDTGNLALSMLGLPPIPGSTLIPLPPTDSPSLVIVPAPQGYSLQWSAAAAAFTLETSDTITPDATWSPVTSGITTNNLILTYPIPDTSPRFYRLRKN